MFLKTIPVGMFQVNCVIAADEDTREAVVIDPGDEAERIVEIIEKQRLQVKALLHTHGHIDHVMGTTSLHEMTGAPVLIHSADIDIYNSLTVQARMFGLGEVTPAPVDRTIADNEILTWGSLEIKVIFTPGHSPGGCSFQLNDAAGTVICGDTIFAGGIGRTDLWGASQEVLMDSIRNRLLTLGDATPLIPGHGPATTVGRERETNPFLRPGGMFGFL
jgi:hydroxyacylglutathione hydrolase